jgi:hypothetical protein
MSRSQIPLPSRSFAAAMIAIAPDSLTTAL